MLTLNIAAENSKHAPTMCCIPWSEEDPEVSLHFMNRGVCWMHGLTVQVPVAHSQQTRPYILSQGWELKVSNLPSNGLRILPKTDSYTHLMRQMSLLLPPDKTLNLKGNPCNGRKNSKERITVALAYNAYGTDKLPALVSRQE